MFRKIRVRREWPRLLHHRGFTLVEILVAIFTLTVVLLGLAPMAINVIHYNKFTKSRTIGVGLARSKIDDLRRTALTTTLTDANDDLSGTIINQEGVAFTRKVDIIDGAVGNLTTIEVSVTWTDYAEHTITQTTKIYQE